MSSSVHSPGLIVYRTERADDTIMICGSAVSAESFTELLFPLCGSKGGAPDLHGFPGSGRVSDRIRSEDHCSPHGCLSLQSHLVHMHIFIMQNLISFDILPDVAILKLNKLFNNKK